MIDKHRVKSAFARLFSLSDDAAALAAVPGATLAEARAASEEYPGGLAALDRRIAASVAASKLKKS